MLPEVVQGSVVQLYRVYNRHYTTVHVFKVIGDNEQFLAEVAPDALFTLTDIHLGDVILARDDHSMNLVKLGREKFVDTVRFSDQITQIGHKCKIHAIFIYMER